MGAHGAKRAFAASSEVKHEVKHDAFGLNRRMHELDSPRPRKWGDEEANSASAADA
jgi:hypothetical protein